MRSSDPEDRAPILSEEEIFVIFDTLDIPGKTAGDALLDVRSWSGRKRNRTTVKRVFMVAAELAQIDKSVLTTGELKAIAQTVGYGVNPKRVAELNRLRELWKLRKKPSGTVGQREEDNHPETGNVVQLNVEYTIEPDKAKYFDIGLPSNVVWIDSITVRPSDHGAPFTFMVFDRQQKSDMPKDEEIVVEEHSQGRRIMYIPTRPLRYEDTGQTKRLHCGIAVDTRHQRFDMSEADLEDYLRRPVTFSMNLVLRLRP